MSTLAFLNTEASKIPQSDTLENVRSTVTTVDKDADASVAVSTPERGRLETDPHTDGGLTTHEVASKVTPSERYVPATVSHSSHSDALNNSWSEVGTAAEREAAGQWGHGTLRYQDAMTRIPDGTAFEETYFARDRRGMNEDVTDYMSPSNPIDGAAVQNTAVAGMNAARQANTTNIYQDLYNHRMGLT